jgi:hypothetical protein
LSLAFLNGTHAFSLGNYSDSSSHTRPKFSSLLGSVSLVGFGVRSEFFLLVAILFASFPLFGRTGFRFHL